MPNILERLFDETERPPDPQPTAPASAASSGTSPVVVLLLLAVLIGAAAGYVGSTLGDDPDSLAASMRRSEWQSEVLRVKLYGGEEPEPNWDNRPWVAKNPVVFGATVGGGVFVVGLLVIIANNSSPNRR